MNRTRGRRRSRRPLAFALCAGLGASLFVSPGFAQGTEPAAADVSLRSGELEVAVATDFPRVLGYTDLETGASLRGSDAPVTEIVLNGTSYPVQVEAGESGDGSASALDYVLTFPDLPDVRIDARIDVEGNAVTFRVTGIEDTEDFRVGTIEIVGHDLVSVSSSDPGARIASAIISPDRTSTGDTFEEITLDTPADPEPRGAAYVIVNTDELAAAVVTNSVYDEAQGKAGREANRVQRQVREDGDQRAVSVWSGAWTYRGEGSPTTEELPYATVAVTADANGDGTVDWQDGAIAYRDVAPKAMGADEVPGRVVTHIPFNFASQATHPFLRTLDDVKRISLATDGLGQLALLKGYGAEGHDSAHPDFGGNYNERAGGLDDLNALLEMGDDWNADFSVHVNATESYPEANAFSEELVDPNARGWNWLNQSYYIHQRRDLTSGDLQDRLTQLAEETNGNLDALYVDVYYNHGWQARALAGIANDLGFQITTEWSAKFERESLWSHWSADENYGGATNKGLNSQIVRFIRNAEKDTWNPHPLLGNARIVEFQGWTGQTDWHGFYRNIWANNLLAKFLQHHEIVRWADDEIAFTGDVVARGTDTEDREVLVGDAVVAQGDTYLLPWDADGTPGKAGDAPGTKLYHYNPEGGSTTWTLTAEHAGARQVTVYELSQAGREKVGTVPVVDGTVTIDASADQPYVVYPDQRGNGPRDVKNVGDVTWGDGTPITDPGFNALDFDAYATAGEVTIDYLDNGQIVAALGSGAASLSQRLDRLEPGTYAASAWIEIEPGSSRTTTLSVSGQGVRDAGTVVERTTARNWVAADEKHSTYFQRVQVLVDVERRTRPTITIEAGEGEAVVRVDDLRIVPAERPEAPDAAGGEVVAFEDFENVPQGWGPFVKGDAGRVTDPRTHIAKRNEPYTQAGWNGKLVDDVLSGDWALKAHEENQGLVYRTVPHTVRFEPGRRYEVSFDYQSGHAGYYTWVTGYDSVASGEPVSVETHSEAIGEQRTTRRFTQEVIGSPCGDTWTGLRKLAGGGSEADFILDDFTVVDLGPAEETPACASLEIDAGRDALEPDTANTVTTSLAIHEAVDVAGVEVTLDVPDGWSAEPASPAVADEVEAGAVFETTWEVTPGGEITPDAYELMADAVYTTTAEPVGERAVDASAEVRVVVPPASGENWLSDLPWVSETNGWGPAERDMANGGQVAGDGPPMTLRGTVYEKGIGAHAPSRIRIFLAERCETFVADTGVDDSQGSRGSVVFRVEGDGSELAETPLLRGGGEVASLDVSVAGVRYLDLIVTDGGDGNGNDHANWAGAKVTCE